MKTNSSLCVGCNKCVFKCPAHANEAVLENGENKVYVNNDLCIWCGKCLEVCDHGAREITDDTERFFDALKAGEQISVIAAPSIKYNIKEYRRLFGYLKSQGVNLVYDVSFGADISVWGYLKEMNHPERKTMIAQPCPVIVKYIEHFKPELIPYLAPVHSPALCTGIYLKKYKNCTDKIAFLSPCSSKAMEIADENTGGYVTYNVTYKGIRQYLEKKKVILSDYEASAFDSPKGSLGTLFPKPGGLQENIRFYLGDQVWIKQVEGIYEVESYLNEYLVRMQHGQRVPVLVDALNCRYGCSRGTAVGEEIPQDDIDSCLNQMKKDVTYEEAAELFRSFDDVLNVEDFTRYYTDKSSGNKEADNAAIEKVFLQMKKYTEEERNVNCFSCGYGNCREFASAVALGQNHIDNCFQYTKTQLARQKEELAEKHNTIISSLNYASKIQRNLLPNEEYMKQAFPEHHVLWSPKDIVGGDIYWLRNFEDGALLCVCDCTGHGTPGALLTMLVVTALDSVVRDFNYKNTAYILWALDQRMKRALNVTEKEVQGDWKSITEVNDGADLALLFVHNSGEVFVSAANTRVFVCDGKKVLDIKGQHLRVGTGQIISPDEIKTYVIPPDPANKYYAASDGLFDQIGEKARRPFGYSTFKKIILEHHEENLCEIFGRVQHEFEVYKGKECRRDDIAMVGFRP